MKSRVSFENLLFILLVFIGIPGVIGLCCIISKILKDQKDKRDNKARRIDQIAWIREEKYKVKIEEAFLEEIEKEFGYRLNSISGFKNFLSAENREIEEKHKIRLREFEEEVKKRERILTEKESFLKTRSAKFPPLAHAFARYDELCLLAIPDYLERKPHPARSSAELARAAIKNAKDYILKFHAAKNLIDSYESLFPWLEEYREFDLDDVINDISSGDKTDHDSNDPVRYYIPAVEYEKMSPAERNQKALDRYIESHKSKVQIGRLYERYIGYEYEMQGYEVSYFGAINGLEDLGRDLIARKRTEILIIQCKYWSKEKQIRENAICQLYGTGLKYTLEHRCKRRHVKSILVTSARCSDMAHSFARELGVEIIEGKPYKDYPMIKCNVGKDGDRIYHLPIDQMYDKIKIEPSKGECYATTCFEAELLGFRRAYRWLGDGN